MKILQLCLRIPFPPLDGGSIAMLNLARSLMNAGAEVKMLAFNTKKHFVPDGVLDPVFQKKFSLETVYLDASVNYFHAIANLIFSNKSYNISRFESEEFRTKLESILRVNSFDIVQVESLFLAPYVETIRKNSKAKIALRAHNVEFKIWERLRDTCFNPFRQWYLAILAGRIKNFELSMMNSYDAIISITPEDEKVFREYGCKIPVHISPVGIDFEKYSDASSLQEPFSIFHLGSMDWMPNLEAVKWFAGEIMPKVLAENSKLEIFFAGRCMPAKFMKLNKGRVKVESAITDSMEYMKPKTVMIVPLLSGSGMRVKIIEGMAMGKTVITTPIGAEGIECIHGKNILIADTADEFAYAISKCYSTPAMCKEIGMNARRLIQDKYDNSRIGNELLKFYSRLTIMQ
jgi:glycosyltransferase involved in cell wall biosynthesis